MLIVLTIIALIISAYFIWRFIDKKNDNIKVYYNDLEITNYKSNTLPFTIESDEEIYVNGKKYNGARIYELGEYEIETSKYKKIVNIKEPDGNVYDFYITTATLSTLYTALIMVENANPAYIFYTREDTLDKDFLEKNTNYMLSKYIGLTSSINDYVIDEVKEKITNILSNESDARFHLYIDEFNYQVEYETFAELGLNDARYDVSYITNGTISYERPYVYLEDESYDAYLENKKEFFNILDKVRSGVEYDGELVYDHVLIAASRDNTNYYLQYPEVLEIKDDKTKNELKINYIAKGPNDLYSDLTDFEKEKLLDYVGLDKQMMDEEYFAYNSKPYLIITGNNPMDYNYGRGNFENMVEQVVNKYGDEYIILFKPHPAALPDSKYEEFFDNLEIKILPGQMPMEVISFVYSDLKLGGFAGSLYMSANSENVLFFFAKDKKELFSPLDLLCETAFSDVEFIQPK